MGIAVYGRKGGSHDAYDVISRIHLKSESGKAKDEWQVDTLGGLTRQAQSGKGGRHDSYWERLSGAPKRQVAGLYGFGMKTNNLLFEIPEQKSSVHRL